MSRKEDKFSIAVGSNLNYLPATPQSGDLNVSTLLQATEYFSIKKINHKRNAYAGIFYKNQLVGFYLEHEYEGQVNFITAMLGEDKKPSIKIYSDNELTKEKNNYFLMIEIIKSCNELHLFSSHAGPIQEKNNLVGFYEKGIGHLRARELFLRAQELYRSLNLKIEEKQVNASEKANSSAVRSFFSPLSVPPKPTQEDEKKNELEATLTNLRLELQVAQKKLQQLERNNFDAVAKFDKSQERAQARQDNDAAMIDSLRKQLAESKSGIQSVNDKYQAALRKEKQKAEDDNKSHKNELAEKNRQIQNLKMQITQLTELRDDRIIKLEKQLAMSSEGNQQLKRTVDDLHKKLNAASARHSVLKAAYDNLHSSNCRLGQTLKQSNADRSQFQTQIEGLIADKDRLTHELQQVRSQEQAQACQDIAVFLQNLAVSNQQVFQTEIDRITTVESGRYHAELVAQVNQIRRHYDEQLHQAEVTLQSQYQLKLQQVEARYARSASSEVASSEAENKAINVLIEKIKAVQYQGASVWKILCANDNFAIYAKSTISPDIRFFDRGRKMIGLVSKKTAAVAKSEKQNSRSTALADAFSQV